MPITYVIKTDRLNNKGIEQRIIQNKVRMIKKVLKQDFLSIGQIAEKAEVRTGYVISIRDEARPG